MFEINLFNSAQIFDQIFAFICVYLLIETELWWLLAAMPLWVFINYKGLINNWREFKGEETTT